MTSISTTTTPRRPSGAGATATAGSNATTSHRRPGPLRSMPIEMIGRIGQVVVAVPAYLGGLAILLMAAAASVVPGRRRVADAPPFWATMSRELGTILALGVPIIGIVHVGMGSSLSLQAYFGSTFVDGTGAVVGVGLLRNIASLTTGMSMAGLLACRYIPGEGRGTRGEGRGGRDGGNRDVAGAVAAPRLAAAAIATVLLSFWGFLVGSFIGWQAAREMMGLSTSMYFLMFYRMIWFRDVIGLIVKGLFFGLAVASVCCFEGLRRGEADGSDAGTDPTEALAVPMVRAVCVSMVATLILNSSWFLMVYHAVPVYGPTLLQPPTP